MGFELKGAREREREKAERGREAGRGERRGIGILIPYTHSHIFILGYTQITLALPPLSILPHRPQIKLTPQISIFLNF